MPDQKSPPSPASSTPLNTPASQAHRKNFFKCFFKYLALLAVSGLSGSASALAFFYFFPSVFGQFTPDGLTAVHNQIATLQSRMDDMEHAEKAAGGNTGAAFAANPELLKDFESRLAALNDQVQSLQAASSTGEGGERAPPREDFDQKIAQVTEAQQAFKNIVLFWHLKEKIWSGAPYAPELLLLSAGLGSQDEKEGLDLSLLEKYANKGIGEEQQAVDVPLKEDKTSWAGYLRQKLKSVIKIEKVDAPSSSPSALPTAFPAPLPTAIPVQDRQGIENILTRLEETLLGNLSHFSFIKRDFAA